MKWQKVLRSVLLASIVAAIVYSYSIATQAQMPSSVGGVPQAQAIGKLEAVARFDEPMPTGVTVSRSGRVFVNFPKWGDPVQYTVAEVKNGQTVAFPDAELNRSEGKELAKALISVQSVVVDPSDRLWLLDTGSIKFAPTQYGGPKLIGIDLQQNRVVKTILFPREVALPASYV